MSKICSESPASFARDGVSSMRASRGHMLLLAADQRRLVESLAAARDGLWQQIQRVRANSIRARLRAIRLRNNAITTRLVFGEAAAPAFRREPAPRRPPPRA